MTEDLSFIVDGVRSEVLFRREPQWPEAAITVYDSNTVRLFGAGSRNPVTIPAGEAAKGWPSVQSILSHCATLGIGRDATIAGVGGGVVCDVTAFAASLYMRGCGLVLIPTTLLAMVDASLGGKTGIDFQGYKNMVGTFYPASRILICAESVRSLPEREYLSGIAEVIKTAIIGDMDLLSLMESGREEVMSRDPVVVQEMIRRSLAVKGRIVEDDPRESGQRALLNLGHTFGHALEAETGYTRFLHGEAVAFGIRAAACLGQMTGHLSAEDCVEILEMLRLYGPIPPLDGIPAASLLARLVHDKKTVRGKVHFVLPVRIGEVAVVSGIDETLVLESIRSALS